ncbi:diguanylate cyclase [Methylocystis sp.]|uniref:GGDEF domain-containing protein n=1 Tax=Methylocystis sp. TaxID=1911079 RepID=UPI0025E1D8E4|nr:GGDEF domain-containing protein [Methylocystis sp.]
MRDDLIVYSMPRWAAMRWLVSPTPGAPGDIQLKLIGGLFGTLPVFAAGVINTIAVAAVVVIRQPSLPFIIWLILEVVICGLRLAQLLIARRAASERRETHTDLYLSLGLLWSASIGYGGFVSLTSGDWVVATVACSSATAMVGGVCFRTFGAPRLATAMMLLSLGPFAPAVIIAGEPLLYVVLLQVPLYLAAMSAAAFTLNKMLVATMRGEWENGHRAEHDALTGLSNRVGLAVAVEASLKSAPPLGGDLAILFLDLDNFKAVNDTYGHAAGDSLLKLVAERLRHSLRATDIAARIGGDEFVVLAKGLTSEQAAELSDRLTSAISASYDLGDGVCATIGVSVGVALVPEHGSDAEALLAVADEALYEAKAQRQVKLLHTLVREDSLRRVAPAAGGMSPRTQ